MPQRTYRLALQNNEVETQPQTCPEIKLQTADVNFNVKKTQTTNVSQYREIMQGKTF